MQDAHRMGNVEMGSIQENTTCHSSGTRLPSLKTQQSDDQRESRYPHDQHLNLDKELELPSCWAATMNYTVGCANSTLALPAGPVYPLGTRLHT